jgi:mono/diheme cytochrome c family protein
MVETASMKLRPGFTRGAWQFSALLVASGWLAHGAAVDLSKLPPSASRAVDFDRDIRPIFDGTCSRCHGPERPKSHLRLDSREAALKGGDNGVDIIPGDSTNSPLIHYVARLVEDMEMPPAGKGKPLTPEEVGLLRAWIDQGVSWGATNAAARFAFSAAPTLRWIAVSGDKSKFQEIEGMKPGFGGGLEHFALQEQIGRDKKFVAEGHVLFPDQDVRLSLSLEKTDLGFVRGGFEQWRKYYDDTGGYYRPFPEPSFNLGRDLYLDIGRAWIDFGLALPRWPLLILGYEYQFKEGAKSTLQWGNVTSEAVTKLIYPAAKNIDEHTHVIRLDVTDDFYGWHLEDNARVEIFESRTRTEDLKNVLLWGPPAGTVRTSEDLNHVQGMNAFRLERQLTDWWLASGGYLYSRFEGESSLSQVTVNSSGVPITGQFWSSDDVVLKRESHILSLANLFLPVDWLSASAGIQSEWTRQEGAGNVNLDQGDPNLPPFFLLYPAMVQSDLDKQELSESALVRFTKIPFTVLFGEGRFSQQTIGQFEQDMPLGGTAPNPEITFLRNTDFTNDRREWRAGFDTSPWRWIVLGAHYRKRVSDSDYDTTKVTADPSGYPGFILWREIDTDETQAKLVLRPATWLKATLTYQLVATDYSTKTEPGPGGSVPQALLAGNYDANVYGLNLILTPLQRLYFSASFTYSDTEIRTASNKDPSIVPYRGNVYSLLASATYALNPATDLRAAYSFSRADYGQNNVADGLPLGLDLTRNGVVVGVTRKMTSYLTTNLRYAFYQYSEPSTGGFNDYTAHGIFATVVMKWR